MRSTRGPTEAVREGAYEVVSLGEGWGILSLGFFFLSLGARPLLSLLPNDLQYRAWTMMPPLAVVLVPIFATLGLVCALLGKRTRGSLTRITLYLNAVVLAISGLLVALIVVWVIVR